MVLAMLFLAPSILTVLALALALPLTLAWHHRAATRPLDELPQDGWADQLLAELEPPRCAQHQRQPRRMARAVQRSRQHRAAWALRKSPRPDTCPPTLRTPYAPTPLHH